MCITHGVGTLVGAPGNLVPLIADDAGRVAIPGRDRRGDSTIAVADEILFQYLTSGDSIQSRDAEWLFRNHLKSNGLRVAK